MSEQETIATIAHALSDPIRVQILQVMRGKVSVCACEFQEKLGLPQSKASYHLRILVDAGILSREVRGTWSHYSIVNKQAVERLWDALSGTPFKPAPP